MRKIKIISNPLNQQKQNGKDDSESKLSIQPAGRQTKGQVIQKKYSQGFPITRKYYQAN